MSAEKALAALKTQATVLQRAADEDQMRHISEIKRQADKYRAFFKEGYAGKAGTRASTVDAKQLAMGIKVEMEHTSDLATATRISLDHLAEIKDYYTRLKKMEAEAGVKE